MRVIRRAGPAAALILCSLPLHGGEAPWLEVKSAHFTVVTNSGEKSGRRMAWRFEQVRAVYQQLWPWANLGFGRPVVVLAVRDEKSLKALAPEYWERKGYRPTSVFVSGQDRHTHYRLGQLLWTRDLDRAGLAALAGHLEKSVQLNPEYANARSLLAQTKGDLGLADEGLTLARKAVALEPNEPYHRLVLARLLWDQRQPDQAKVEAQGALRRARSDHDRREARELLAFMEKNAPPPK